MKSPKKMVHGNSYEFSKSFIISQWSPIVLRATASVLLGQLLHIPLHVYVV